MYLEMKLAKNLLLTESIFFTPLILSSITAAKNRN